MQVRGGGGGGADTAKDGGGLVGGWRRAGSRGRRKEGLDCGEKSAVEECKVVCYTCISQKEGGYGSGVCVDMYDIVHIYVAPGCSLFFLYYTHI
mmetsp:Transcript_41601/g.71674  ORF Transcript_41601/g.71674 Transcript_41601/m.71674 type:complete len:94 (+) Transcript_41601:462-743(+)